MEPDRRMPAAQRPDQPSHQSSQQSSQQSSRQSSGQPLFRPPASVTAEHPAVHDPARRRAATSLWRLRGYLRPYVGALLLMGGAATAGVFVALAIPLVIRAIIDGPITDGDRSGIWPLGLLALTLGVVEAALILIRRWVQARAVLGVETAIRRDLYAKLDSSRWRSTRAGRADSCCRG